MVADRPHYYLWGYIPFPIVLGAYYLFGGGWWMYTPLFTIFGVIPLLDYVFDIDDCNPTAEESKKLDKNIAFRLVVMGWLPAQLLLIVWGCAEVERRSTPASSFDNDDARVHRFILSSSR